MSPALRASLGVMIRQARRYEKLTRQELAARTGLEKFQIAAIESGYWDDAATVLKIAVFLGVNVADISPQPSLSPRWLPE